MSLHRNAGSLARCFTSYFLRLNLFSLSCAESLKSAFSRAPFAPVLEAVVMKEPGPGGRSRGFGFVRLKTKAGMDAAIKESGMAIDGRRVSQSSL